jgi:hypothetical protein
VLAILLLLSALCALLTSALVVALFDRAEWKQQTETWRGIALDTRQQMRRAPTVRDDR